MRVVCVVSLLTLANCAGVVEGYSQTITVNTDPSGATCRLDRDGTQLGTVDSTPGAVIVKPKSERDIQVTCEKPGFVKATTVNKSDVAAATFGNILVGGVIGAIADKQTGAAYKYDGVVNVKLLPVSLPLSSEPAT